MITKRRTRKDVSAQVSKLIRRARAAGYRIRRASELAPRPDIARAKRAR